MCTPFEGRGPKEIQAWLATSGVWRMAHGVWRCEGYSQGSRMSDVGCMVHQVATYRLTGEQRARVDVGRPEMGACGARRVGLVQL